MHTHTHTVWWSARPTFSLLEKKVGYKIACKADWIILRLWPSEWQYTVIIWIMDHWLAIYRHLSGLWSIDWLYTVIIWIVVQWLAIYRHLSGLWSNDWQYTIIYPDCGPMTGNIPSFIWILVHWLPVYHYLTRLWSIDWQLYCNLSGLWFIDWQYK